MAESPVLYVYYRPANDDAYPGVPGRHITEDDWARFSPSQRRTVEEATTQDGYTRRKVWLHRDLVDETEQERAEREAAEQAARDAYERGSSIVRYREFEKVLPGPGEVIVGTAAGVHRAPISTTRVGLGAQGSVAISWDDGYATWRQIGEMAAARGQRHTFFVQPKSGEVIPNRITVADIQALHKMGHEIGAHSVTHINYVNSTPAQRAAETDGSVAALEDMIGAPVTSFAYPYGARNITTDRELYGRVERVAGVSYLGGAQVGLPWTYPYTDRSDFVTGRISHDGTDRWQQFILREIERLPHAPHVLAWFGHDLDRAGNMSTAQLTELLDAVQASGAAAVTYRDAFPGQSALVDGSFESGSLGVWQLSRTNGSSVAEVVDDTPDTGIAGTKSAHLVNAGGSVYISQYVPVVPGMTYTFSGRVRTTDTVGGTGGPGVTLRAVQYGLDTPQQASSYSAAVTSSGWTRAEVTFPVGTNIRAVRLDCVILTNVAEAWFDHLHFGQTAKGSFG